MGSTIRKNSPTVAVLDGSTTQKQLTVDGSGYLEIAIENSIPLNGTTSFYDDSGVPTLAAALTDDSPGSRTLGTEQAVLIAAFNEINTSYRYVRQNNTDGLLNGGITISQGDFNIKSASATNPTGAINAAFLSIFSDGTPISIYSIKDINCIPNNAAYSNFTCTIVYEIIR